jgi:GNAT superfamily N-acetyltransferase
VVEVSPDLLAGYVHVFLTKRLFLAEFAELGGLVVDEKFRGSGIGGLLLKRSEVWAEQQGSREMRVRSNLLREKARDFYLSRGYRDSKHQAVYLKVLCG